MIENGSTVVRRYRRKTEGSDIRVDRAEAEERRGARFRAREDDGGGGAGGRARERDGEDQRKQPSRLARQLGRAVRGHGQVIWSRARGVGADAQSSQLHPSAAATTACHAFPPAGEATCPRSKAPARTMRTIKRCAYRR